MKNSIPKISVLLPVFNGGEYLKQSVLSVLNQQLENFELLILDDCSTDDSFSWLQSIDDQRICLFQNEVNKGLFYNLNFLASKATSPLLKLWAQDDIMYPHCLQGFVRFHEKHTNIGFSYSARDIIDENGKIVKSANEDTTSEILDREQHAIIAYYCGSIAGNIANTCIVKNAFEKVGRFNESMKISGDFDMWVRLAEHYNTGFIKETLIQLRDHKAQLSRREDSYIFHVLEDIEVYKKLDNYAQPNTIVKGKKMMTENKLLFYYTLMLKEAMAGKFHIAKKYWHCLSGYTDMNQLTKNFIKIRLFNKKPLDLETVA